MSEKRLDGIDLLAHLLELKPSYCLFTTYSLDLAFFELELFDKLQDQSEDMRLVLLADRQAYRDTAASGRFVRKAEFEYRFLPVDAPEGVFHPKVFLLGGSDWARLYVGSANLTRPGLTRNLEIIDMISCSPDDNQHAGCLRGACNFLEAIASQGLVGKRARHELDAIRTLAAKLCPGEHDSIISFGSTLQDSLAAFALKSFPPDTKEITICSPFHDPKNGPFELLAGKFPKADFKIVVPEDHSPFNMPKSRDLAKRVALVCFRKKAAGDRRLHAKCMLAKGSSGSVLVTGSPNFTQAGFLCDWRKGNIETWLARHGSRDSFDEIFKDDWELKQARTDIAYIPMEWSPRPAAPPIGVEFASYDDSTLTMEIGLKGFALKPDDQVVALIEGRLGAFQIKACPPLGASLKFRIDARDAGILTAPASVTLVVRRGESRYASEPTFLELKGWLALDSSERRLRYTIADVEASIVTQGGTYDGRGVHELLRALTDFIRVVSSQGPEPDSGEGAKPTPEDDDAGWRRPSHGHGSQKVQLLGEMLGALRRITAHDHHELQSMRRATRRSEATEDGEEQESDSGEDLWQPNESFLRDFNARFDEILELINDIPLSNSGRSHQVLNALECLAHLSFVVNIIIIGLNDELSVNERSGAFALHERHWLKLAHFLLEDDTEESHVTHGWLVRCGSADWSGDALPAIVIGLTAFLGKWAMDATAKGLRPRIAMLRNSLGILEERFGLTKDRFRETVPDIHRAIEKFHATAALFPSGDQIAKQIQELYGQPRIGEYVQDQLGLVRRLERLELRMAGEKDVSAKAALEESRKQLLQEIGAKKELRDFLSAYEACLRRSPTRATIFFIDPMVQGFCPGCRQKIPAGLASQLRSPTRLCPCSNCDAILYGAAQHFAKEENTQ